MEAVKFEQRAIPIITDEGIKYAPGIRLGGKGDFNLVAHQGEILTYETKEEAESYFE